MRWHFYVAVSHQIGIGHLMRAITLSHHLHPIPVKIWAYTDWTLDALRRFAPTTDLNVVEPNRPVPTPDSWVDVGCLIDIPVPPASLLQSTGRSRKKIILGQTGRATDWADLVINSAEGQSLLPSVSYNERGVAIWQGAAYAILRQPFLAGRSCPYNSTGEVLVMMGGTDAGGITRGLVRTLIQQIASHSLCVVVRDENTQKKILDDMDLSNRRRIRIVGFTHEIDELMKRASVAIVGAGVSLFECLALRTPAIAIAQNERQRKDFAQYPWLVSESDLGAVLDQYWRLKANLSAWFEYADRVKAGSAWHDVVEWMSQ